MINSLIGVWLFVGLLYQGHELPVPNPNLRIYYTFESAELNSLYYFRLGESGFCERKARYSFSNGLLSQEVFWVHDQNASWCDQDPDMRLGSKSVTALKKVDGRLYLSMKMGEETISYIWEGVESTGSIF